MAVVSVHRFKQCITCHAWSPDHSSRRGSELEPARWGSMVLLLMGLLSFTVVYIFMSTVMKPSSANTKMGSSESNGGNSKVELSGGGGCCKGIESLELWGDAVKWGTDFKFNSSEGCCKACKDMCTGNEGPCLCDTWVFCGNKEACGDKFGEASYGPPFALIQGTLEAQAPRADIHQD